MMHENGESPSQLKVNSMAGELIMCNDMNELTHILVKPEGGRHLKALCDILNAHTIHIESSYFIRDWQGLAVRIYLDQLIAYSVRKRCAFAGHLTANLALYGNYGIALLLRPPGGGCERGICEVLEAKRMLRSNANPWSAKIKIRPNCDVCTQIQMAIGSEFKLNCTLRDITIDMNYVHSPDNLQLKTKESIVLEELGILQKENEILSDELNLLSQLGSTAAPRRLGLEFCC